MDRARRTEVAQPDLALTVDEDICWFDVAMHDSGSMEEPHRTQQVERDDFDVLFGQETNSFDKQIPQVLSNSLEDDHDPAKWLVTVVFWDDKVKDFGRINVLLHVSEHTQYFYLL